MSKVISLFKKFEYFNSIDDMPIYNFLKIQETNDLGWVMKEKGDYTKRQQPLLEHALQLITDQYIDTYGISDQYRRILRLQGDLRVLEMEYIITGEKINLTFIELKKAELKVAVDQSQSKETVSVKVHAEKYMGRAINMRETSVRDFYDILRELQKEQKSKE